MSPLEALPEAFKPRRCESRGKYGKGKEEEKRVKL
jgi:hypothetical protein